MHRDHAGGKSVLGTLDHATTQLTRLNAVESIQLRVAAVLVFIGLPDKDGESPRFLRFNSAMTFYPTIVMIFFAFGVAELLNWYLNRMR